MKYSCLPLQLIYLRCPNINNDFMAMKLASLASRRLLIMKRESTVAYPALTSAAGARLALMARKILWQYRTEPYFAL